MTKTPVCHDCHHTPSGRYEGAYACRCNCLCHDVADAAPELLAACKGIEHALDEYADLLLDHHLSSSAMNLVVHRDIARAAISKAEAERQP